MADALAASPSAYSTPAAASASSPTWRTRTMRSASRWRPGFPARGGRVVARPAAKVTAPTGAVAPTGALPREGDNPYLSLCFATRGTGYDTNPRVRHLWKGSFVTRDELRCCETNAAVAAKVGLYSSVTFEKQPLNMIVNPV